MWDILNPAYAVVVNNRRDVESIEVNTSVVKSAYRYILGELGTVPYDTLEPGRTVCISLRRHPASNILHYSSVRHQCPLILNNIACIISVTNAILDDIDY